MAESTPLQKEPAIIEQFAGIPDHLKPSFDPIAHPDAIILAGNARFTVLTSRLIRLEYDPAGAFEDRPSQAFWFRKQPVPRFKIRENQGVMEIITDHLQLTYRASAAGFTNENLQIRLLKTENLWHFGDSDMRNLGGTVRTLDTRDGAVSLPAGLNSRSGWSVIDDSKSLVFNAHGWLEARKSATTAAAHEHYRDFYFFGYGSDFASCLRDFCRISGPIPMVPRWALGNWWSRYWPYSHETLMDVVRGFKENGIPLSVLVVDMDWHIVKNDYHGGWTGYTWNRELFPDPRGFLDTVHGEGLHTCLNLHPHAGVHPHEDAYEEFSRFMGIDPSSKKPVEFDVADPRYMTGYFRYLHHPHEQMGIDFWWMDWQQGEKTKLEGLDPLWLLNHLHYHDLGRDGKKRPMIFSRWGEWGNHRYPIGFSGDTVVSWKSLAFQPYLTAAAANTGYCYWSHDIGGHMQGTEDDELYLRWIQCGVFSPVMRIHATCNKYQDRRPWMRSSGFLAPAREIMQLRHRLIPYMYSMSYKTWRESVPMIRPMYFDFPDHELAYSCGWQYRFGSELLAAPITSPRDQDIQLARQVVWLPRGHWYDFFTGEHFSGDRVVSIYRDSDEVPLFARAGAIVPLATDAQWGNTGNPECMDIHCFAGTDGEFELYEDDGVTTGYTKNEYCITRLRQKWSADKLEIIMEPASGALKLIPERRTWRLVITGVSQDARAECRAANALVSAHTAYDPARERLTIALPSVPVTGKLTVTVSAGGASLLSRRNRLEENLDAMLHAFHMPSDRKGQIASILSKGIHDHQQLLPLNALITESQLRAVCEMIYEAGYDYRDAFGPKKAQLLVWNNRETPAITCWLRSGSGSCEERGPVPRQFAFVNNRPFGNWHEKTRSFYVDEPWDLAFNYAGNAIFRMHCTGQKKTE
jgi:alpha-glucosidase (family GH31 glycosyl hydrolase)